MGINYYAHFDTCPCCKRPAVSAHIGKQSAGHRFLLAVGLVAVPDDTLVLDSLKAWMAVLLRPNVKVVDEYGDEKDPLLLFADICADAVAPARTSAMTRADPTGLCDLCGEDFS